MEHGTLEYNKLVDDLKLQREAKKLALKDSNQIKEYKSIARPEPPDPENTVKAEVSLYEFVKQAWPIINPGQPFKDGIHIGAICEHLEAIRLGQIRKLLINIPVRHGKSSIVSVLWPAWEWIHEPTLRWLFAAYSGDLTLRDNIACRAVIQSEWYQRRWGHLYHLVSDQNIKSNYKNNRAGYRIATSVSGTATGEGGNRRVIDDAHNMKDALNDTMIKSAIQWYRQVWVSRKIDPATDVDVMIMQRCRQNDLSGYVLEQGGWEHLCLPFRYVPKPVKHVTCIGWSDPRTEKGELLAPERFPEAEAKILEKEMGPFAAAGQLQQDPVPIGGGMFKRWWWRYYTTRTQPMPSIQVQQEDGSYKDYACITLPSAFDEIIQTWDCSFKNLNDSSYVVGLVIGRKGSQKFFLDVIRERMDIPETLRAIVKTSRKWPTARVKLIEERANGVAVIQLLKKKLTGIMAVDPLGSKEDRAVAMEYTIAAGDVFMPHPQLYSWVEECIHEHEMFPNGANNDQVDAHSQAEAYFEKRSKRSGGAAVAGERDSLKNFKIYGAI